MGSLGFERKIVVGVAEFAVSNSPVAVLATYSLGSCVGIAIHDPVAGVGGILHAMLPDSRISAEKARQRPGMFVDTGLPALLVAAAQLRANKGRILVYVAGGAQIMDASGYFNIGRRNLDSLQEHLQAAGLRVEAAAVGGMVNRTMYLQVATGAVWLKVSGESKEQRLCKQ